MSVADLGMPNTIGGGKLVKHLSLIGLKHSVNSTQWTKVAELTGLSFIKRIWFGAGGGKSAKCRLTIDGQVFEKELSYAGSFIGWDITNYGEGDLPPLLVKNSLIVELACVTATSASVTIEGSLVALEDME
ncbi:hypothetical protein DA096_26180 [Vibrio rotiferianus]|uniref:Uncharacterized protein n=1 Tax=Vibrio rotiferianus TaxID=190895 RepID=A0A510IDP2_9VIBR|nr:hypothetical protein [Vibrio rotiferianus]TMX39765.1 hypothetical protein DA095_09435 [Vibrio rotiferianus]TMX57838.1 hypothetical protein DA096_26180 [Vibrio rotiferianus]TMX59163.1 hypothetical protein DA093_03515 [Vibrio rotiferianus]BBL91833.1 hypothetical protein VroAM7_44860 [Vibrio rotiferianus]